MVLAVVLPSPYPRGRLPEAGEGLGWAYAVGMPSAPGVGEDDRVIREGVSKISSGRSGAVLDEPGRSIGFPVLAVLSFSFQIWTRW